jgi:hypothetical protein
MKIVVLALSIVSMLPNLLAKPTYGVRPSSTSRCLASNDDSSDPNRDRRFDPPSKQPDENDKERRTRNSRGEHDDSGPHGRDPHDEYHQDGGPNS